MTEERETKVVRITKTIYKKAMEAKTEKHDYMDQQSWLSYLIQRGLENIKELRERKERE